MSYSSHLILKRDPNNSKIFDLIGDIHNAQNQQMQSFGTTFHH